MSNWIDNTNKLTSYILVIVITVSLILIGLNIKAMLDIHHLRKVIKQKKEEIDIVRKDLIFRLQDGTVIKLRSINPLIVTILKTGIILEKGGQYYYYTKGNKMYILSNQQYMELIKKRNSLGTEK